uniref:Deacetylase sirtuin-type domain-containing protein n=1 Tax=Aureoumbra lagunensis TaxID=44058 RepID=A0A7S3JYR4_9STRA
MSVEEVVQRIKEDCWNEKSLLVVSGSGVSVSSGLSTFGGGFYERAKKRYKLKDGMDLFRWQFYVKEPFLCTQFLGQMCEQVLKCKPNTTHQAIAKLEDTSILLRHYTLNIDGLHALAGASTWDATNSNSGATVELHGSLREIVCTHTGNIYAVDEAALNRIKRKKLPKVDNDTPIRTLDLQARRSRKRHLISDSVYDNDAESEQHPSRYRFRVLLYDDEEDECVLDSSGALALLDSDAARARIVLWLGISFQQSASCEYLRRVAACTPANTLHLIVNPSTDAAFNAMSAINFQDVNIHAVHAPSDDLFTALMPTIQCASSSELSKGVATCI